MKALLIKIQELQSEIMDFENYSISTIVSETSISASLHSKLKSQAIVASLGFVHKDYIEDSNKAVDQFVDKVLLEIINN